VVHKYDSLISFALRKNADGKYSIENLETAKTYEADPQRVIPYLKGFEAIYYEYIDRKSSEEHLDSIYTSTPRHQIEITLENGEEFSMKTYNMPVRQGAKLGEKLIDYNPERMYIFSSYMRTKHHPIVQNLTFDPLVIDFKYFASSTTVEK
jgi:hypothetical protein